MARINENYDKLAAGYLFPEIARRTNAFWKVILELKYEARNRGYHGADCFFGR